jgi:hypothetical protein
VKTNYAQFKESFAYLSDDFGKKLAMRKFDLTEEELERVVGRYVRGKRKGQLKGMIIWTKCIKGGWVRTGPYDHEQMRAQGYVAQKNRCQDFKLVDAWTKQPYILV